MLLASIPTWGYVVAIVVMELLATVWYISSVRRGKREGVGIGFERFTYISALIVGMIGIAVLVVVPAVLF